MRSTEVGRDRVLSYVSDHRSGGAGGTSACSSWRAIRRYPGLKRLQVWTTWERCRSKSAGPEAGRFYSRDHTEARLITCAFSTLPKEHPIGSLRWPLGSSRYATTESSSVCRLTNEAPAPPKRPGFSRIRRSDSPAPKGGWPASGPGASATGTWQARIRRCPPEWACPPRWARIDAVSGLAGRMSVQLTCL